MGVELHITRANHWLDSQENPITAEEWTAFVNKDPELELWPEQGEYFTRWLGNSEYDDPWLDWNDGEIHSKWPDTALYQKMLSVAKELNAKVQDDDGVEYPTKPDWNFSPNEANERQVIVKPWWKFW